MNELDMNSIVGGALALIASFAWRDFFEAFINRMYPVNGSSNMTAKFIYAVVITSCVFGVFYLYTTAYKKISSEITTKKDDENRFKKIY